MHSQGIQKEKVNVQKNVCCREGNQYSKWWALFLCVFYSYGFTVTLKWFQNNRSSSIAFPSPLIGTGEWGALHGNRASSTDMCSKNTIKEFLWSGTTAPKLWEVSILTKIELSCFLPKSIPPKWGVCVTIYCSLDAQITHLPLEFLVGN